MYQFASAKHRSGTQAASVKWRKARFSAERSCTCGETLGQSNNANMSGANRTLVILTQMAKP